MDTQRGIDDLLSAAIGGDKEAENKLFSQLRVRILQLVQYKIWNTQRHAAEIRKDAEDLTDEICLIILQKYKTRTFDHGFMPFVFRTVRNKIGEYFRMREREKMMTRVKGDEEFPQPFVDPVLPKELDSMISRALKRMGHRCRAIIKALLEGEIKTYIAEQQRTTPIGTIYTQIHRCRQKIAILLRKKGYKI